VKTAIGDFGLYRAGVPFEPITWGHMYIISTQLRSCMLYKQGQVFGKRTGNASLPITVGIFEVHSKGWYSPLVALGLVTGRG
jgi:hypothetical protein